MDSIASIFYHTDCFYPVIFVFHYTLFQILVLTKLYDRWENEYYYQKVVLYNILILYEIIFTVLITFYCASDVMLFLFKSEVGLTNSHVFVINLVGIYMWTIYAYEIAINYKDPPDQVRKGRIPQIMIHHISTMLSFTIGNICIRFSLPSDFVLRLLIYYGVSAGMYHATLDFIMHIPLLLWRTQRFYQIRSFFFWLSYWPLLAFRFVVNIVIVALYISFSVRKYHLSTYAYVWIWSHIILLGLQLMTQIVGSCLMNKIHMRDQIQHNAVDGHNTVTKEDSVKNEKNV